MLVYWLFKSLAEDWNIETISMEDFLASIIVIIGIIVFVIIDAVLLIPELLYIGFKLAIRRLRKLK